MASPRGSRKATVIFSLRREAGNFGYGGGVLLFELGAEQRAHEGRARGLC